MRNLLDEVTITELVQWALKKFALLKHTHEKSEVTGLDTDLSNKADKQHTHAQSDITGLSTTLAGKADKAHTHTVENITDFPTIPTKTSQLVNDSGFVTESGGSEITVDSALSATSTNPVQNKVVKAALDAKANSSHTHEITNVNGLETALSEKAAASHTHKYAASSTAGGAATTALTIATARNINGMTFNGSADRVNYGTCSTAATTAAKVVTCTGFALVTGAEITVKFTVTNSAANPTLNVNNSGAKAIYYRGAAITAGFLAANRTYTFRYNGTQYELVGDLDTNTTYGAATATVAGLVSIGTQTFAGAKTFNGAIYPAGATAYGTPQARKLASGTAAATTSNCPSGAWYGKHS